MVNLYWMAAYKDTAIDVECVEGERVCMWGRGSAYSASENVFMSTIAVLSPARRVKYRYGHLNTDIQAIHSGWWATGGI